MSSAKVVEKTQCPQCKTQGRDNSHDNLAVYEDRSAHCFSCGYHIHTNGKKSMTYSLPTHMPVPNGIKSKAINTGTCQRFGVVHLAAVGNDGVPVTKPNENGEGHTYAPSGVLAFPYFDIETGLPVGAKLRRFKADGTKEMWWDEGTIKEKLTWFGTNASPASATKVVLCEGESDTLSVAQSMPDVAVWGVSGASAIEKAIRGSLHVLKKFKQIVLLLDNDDAGKEATEKALSLLPPGKTFVASLPSDVKDCNELLVNERETDLRRCVRDAKQVTPKGVVDPKNLRERLMDYLFNKESSRGATTGYTNLDHALGGLAPGKMLTICGGTGSGKSTFAESIAVNAAVQANVKTFFIPLEMTDSQVGARMAQQILREPIASDPYYNMNRLDPRKLEVAISTIEENIYFFDHFGSIKMDTLIETCEFAIDAYGCSLIVLDHLTAAASGNDGLDWKALDSASSELKGLALRKGVCIIVVSHISRDGDNEDNVPALRHIRGGNGVAQYSDCVLGVGRKRDSNTMTVRTIKVDRMIGRFVEFELAYESCALQETGTVREFTPEEEEEYEYSESGQEDRKVQESVRSYHRSDEQTDEVRATEVAVRDEAPVQPGLHASERDTRGSEGVVSGGGQKQTAEGARPTPRAGLEAPLPSWLEPA